MNGAHLFLHDFLFQDNFYLFAGSGKMKITSTAVWKFPVNCTDFESVNYFEK